MISVADLVELDIRQLAATLPERLPDPSSLAPHEWLFLVGSLANMIIESAELLTPSDWISASRAELHALAMAQAAKGIDHLEHVIRRINLTAALLTRVAADEHIAIRNPRIAMDLVLDNLPISPEQARDLAPRWRELTKPELLRLRIARNLLTPAWMINAHAPDSRIDTWVDVYPHLP